MGRGRNTGVQSSQQAQQHRVAHTLPDCHGDILHQHRIDAHADHNKKCLKAQRQQGLQVILLNRFLRASPSGIALASSPRKQLRQVLLLTLAAAAISAREPCASALRISSPLLTRISAPSYGGKQVD